MKNLKKLLAVIVSICVLATFAVPAFAADAATYVNADQATKLHDMGLYAGTSSTVFTPDLGSKLTREQGMVLLLALFGKTDAANALTDEEVSAALAGFTDASTISSWAKKPMAYALKNKITAGVSATQVGPKGTLTGNQLATFILVQAGYTVADWTKAAADLDAKGTTGATAVATAQLTRDDFAGIAFGTLTVKNAAGKTVIEALVDAGKVTAAAAEAAGVYAGKVSATVAVTGAKILTVTFNQAIDTTKASVAVKKGTVAVNTDKIEYAADKKSATITTTTKLSEGDYTVTVSGLGDAVTATVKAANEKVTKINLLTTKAARTSDVSGSATNAYVSYEVLNQYGEKMKGEVINWTISTGKAIANNNAQDCHFEIVAASGDFVPGAIVYITGVHTGSGTVVNGSVEIALAPKSDSLVFKGVYDRSNNKLTSLPAGFAVAPRWALLYEVMDQYGNKINSPVFADIVFTTSNPAFVGATFNQGADVVIDGVTYTALNLVPGSNVNAGGSVTISGISKYTGKTSSYTTSSDALAAVKTFTMSAPASIVAEGETVEIPFSAIDQYGNAVTSYDSLNGKVTFSPDTSAANGNLAFEKQNDGSAKLKYTAPAAGADANTDYPVYLTSLVAAGGSFSSQMVSVKDKAVPTAIIGLDSDKTTNIAAGNTETIGYANLTIQDQYGRTMKDDDVKAWLNTASANSIAVTSDATTTTAFTVKLNAGSDSAKCVLAGDTDTVTIAPAAVDATTETITFTLSASETAATVIDASAKALTFTKINKSQYSSYVVDDFGAMYNDGVAGTATNSKFDKTVKVYGVMADGTKVQLPATDYRITTDGKLSVNNTTGAISDVTTAGYIAGDFKDGTADKNQTVNVLVTVNDLGSGSAIAIIEKTLTVSNIAPKVAVVGLNADNVTDGKATLNPTTGGAISVVQLNAVIDTSEVKDQYGVEFTEAPVITITGLVKVDGSTFNVTGNGTNAAAITGAKLGDKFTATFKYASGVSVKIDFTVGK